MCLWAILEVWVLRLVAGQVESLWDEVLPVGVRELPKDLRQIDVLLSDPGLVAPIALDRRDRGGAGPGLRPRGASV